MNYWLLKSEPSGWSWQDQCEVGAEGTQWDGVKNFMAAANMRSMQIGDEAFFYHSVNEKRIVGIVRVIRAAYPDPNAENDKFCLIDVAAIAQMTNPIELKQIKQTEELQDMVLVKNSRLSVQPVTTAQWCYIVEHGKPLLRSSKLPYEVSKK